DWIVKGIPEDVRVAHKYGRELHVVNDAGIAFTDKPFILVIMSKGIVEKEADAIFPELARIVYDVQTEN
ncbi:serine hydrolase, partial [Candidatus Woesebacteria bacterium]|nr:serine hydrolase [Candidatus Woesebacteria bacterium]